ncbi:MAG: hypothetical protein JWN71_2678 [Xanthobacteraceae bacterium]|nr:hypothetical protein [Xanthobacteraceae bacterium]
MHHRKRSDEQSVVEAKAAMTTACRALKAAVLLSTAGALCLIGDPASAQNPPQTNKTVMVSLIGQDFSDCTNTSVKDDPNRTRGGEIKVARQGDNTTVAVAMTANANTTYHFFLKCVRQLGDIVTDGDGIGTAVFTFPNALTGPVFAFDMYPEGAPAGNKFQSLTTDLR